MDLSSEIIAKIDEIVGRYPQKRSAALPLLHLIQEEKGYISDQAIEWIAQRLDLQPINIEELVTFYPMFRKKPLGCHHIRVCRTLSCALVGGYKVHQALRESLGLEDGHMTAKDGLATVEFVECLASCGTGPVMMVGDCLHEKVTPEKAQALIARLREEAASVAPAP